MEVRRPHVTLFFWLCVMADYEMNPQVGKEDQSVDTSFLLRIGNKIPMEGVTETIIDLSIVLVMNCYEYHIDQIIKCILK
jgi:hypothetical protein